MRPCSLPEPCVTDGDRELAARQADVSQDAVVELTQRMLLPIAVAGGGNAAPEAHESTVEPGKKIQERV